MREVRSSVILVWEVWVLLLFGYLWLLVSQFLSCDNEVRKASGAVLVGAAIIAELVFKNMAWRNQYTHPSIKKVKVNCAGFINSKLDNGCIDVGFELVTSDYKPSFVERYTKQSGFGQSRFKHLLNLSIPDTDSNGWCDFKNAKTRFEYWVTYAITVSVLLGTLTWAYGLSIPVISITALSLAIAQLFAPR